LLVEERREGCRRLELGCLKGGIDVEKGDEREVG
jgi:hypothetical protein